MFTTLISTSRMRYLRYIFLMVGTLTLSIFNCGIVSADPGEVDEKGGHYNQKTGEYHYHQPIAPPTEQSSLAIQSRAITDAENDAAASVDRMIWGGGTFIGTSLVGCLFCGLPAIIAASIYEPSPPAQRLMGKSPEYVMVYQKTYGNAVRSRQARSATLGCLGGSVVAGIVWGVFFSE